MRNFYLINQYPCFEWLKRIKADLVDICLACGENQVALMYASMLEDMDKVTVSLLSLEGSKNVFFTENDIFE